MADERLRELERLAKASGDPLDKGALLRARVRAGAITQDRLELAAYAGHPGARVALGGQPVSVVTKDQTITSEPDSFNDWVVGFNRWPHDVRVRMNLAAAKVACAAAFSGRHSEADHLAVAAFRAIEAWLVCPCDEHVNKWINTWDDAWEEHHSDWIPPPWEGHVWVIIAARVAGEQEVRARILRDVGRWALQTEV
jgi:hypothetical protein